MKNRPKLFKIMPQSDCEIHLLVTMLFSVASCHKNLLKRDHGSFPIGKGITLLPCFGQ